MECTSTTTMLFPISKNQCFVHRSLIKCTCRMGIFNFSRIFNKMPPKNLRYPRREKIYPDPRIRYFLKQCNENDNLLMGSKTGLVDNDKSESMDSDIRHGDGIGSDENIWYPEEIDAISSLFQGRVPQKPGELNRTRPLPLTQPHKLRSIKLPTRKEHVKAISVPSQASLSKDAYKNPMFLIGLAKEIKSLSKDEEVVPYLNKWAHLLRKGSLSLTIRELDRLGVPERALQTFCWAQKQPLLFPDDRILASTVEVLAKADHLKVSFNLKKLSSLATLPVIEAMARGYIRGGTLIHASNLLRAAKKSNRTLGVSVYTKLILKLGKNPKKEMHILALLNELGEREDLKLGHHDCIALMNVCLRMGKYEIVESLFNWFKESRRSPTIAMYTTLLKSRCLQQKYREALGLVWEMEELNCMFDLPAYGVVIKLMVALGDLPRAVRYFSKLKVAGFAPNYDVYRDMMSVYMFFGRVAKCREVSKEAEMAGFKVDKEMLSQLQVLKDAL